MAPILDELQTIGKFVYSIFYLNNITDHVELLRNKTIVTLSALTDCIEKVDNNEFPVVYRPFGSGALCTIEN